MTVNLDGTISANLKIDTKIGGIEVRANGELHYWNNESQDVVILNDHFKEKIKYIVRRVYTVFSDDFLGAKNCLADIFNQFGVVITEE